MSQDPEKGFRFLSMLYSMLCESSKLAHRFLTGRAFMGFVDFAVCSQIQQEILADVFSVA